MLWLRLIVALLGVAHGANTNPSNDTVVDMTPYNWMAVVEEASLSMMYLQKAARLFVQAAIGVNPLDSKVLFSDARVNSATHLRILLEGSDRYSIPARWFTAEIETQYLAMQTQWTDLQNMLAAEIQSVNVATHYSQISRTAAESAQLYDAGVQALEDTVHACLSRDPTIPCMTVKILGRQRALLQKMSFEAMLQGAGYQVENKKAEMVDTIALFEQTQLEVTHGKAPDVPRTTDHCILQQMKDVNDAFSGFKKILDLVYMGDTSTETLFLIDTAQWKAGVDPMYYKVTEALHSYENGHGECTQVGEKAPTRQEYEAAIKTTGLLKAMSQKLAADFLYELKDISSNKAEDISTFDRLLARLTSGWSEDELPAPPSQIVADLLFKVSDGSADGNNGWLWLKSKLPAPELSQLTAVSEASKDIVTVLESLANEWIDIAWANNQDVPGSRSNLAGTQAMLIERMAKEALLIASGMSSARGDLSSSIDEFERNHDTLIHGNGLIGKEQIQETTEEEHEDAMAVVAERWAVVKPLLQEVANAGYASKEGLENIKLASSNVATELAQVRELYSALTITTTKVSVDLMVLLPFTGRWHPGKTMEVASRVAEDLINEQQNLLDGYKIKSSIYDDGCDTDRANREMLEHFAASDKWVGVGGMACNAVCESLAVITASLFLPTISYECSAGSLLSDETLFPSFVRLGTGRVEREVSILTELKSHVPWWEELVLISSLDVVDTYHVDHVKHVLEDAGFAVSSLSADETSWESTTNMMSTLKTRKQRVIYYVGTEAYFRHVLCAMNTTGTPPGVAWISEGVKSKAWWTHADTDLLLHHAECTPELVGSVYQGAVSFTGLGRPDGAALNDPLDCFEGYTSASLKAHIMDVMTTGYTPASGGPMLQVERPHVELVNFVVDGVCSFAKMIRHMLAQGHSIEDLRSPQEAIFDEAVHFVRHDLDFTGSSGRVKFDGNDLPGPVAVWQAVGGEVVLAGLAPITGDVDLGNLALDFWSEAPPDPVTPMTEANWMNVVDIASHQLYYFVRSTRLFMQAAEKVNTLDSRVLFSDARVKSISRIEFLLEGSERMDIPVKWFSESIKERLDYMTYNGHKLEEIMAERVETVDRTELDLVADIATRFDYVYDTAEAVLDAVVDECKVRAPQVPCTVLRTLGRQAVLLNMMSFEAVLQAIGHKSSYNRDRMLKTSKQFAQAHYDVVHGDGHSMARTNDYCILQQMKHVHDDWLPFEADIAKVYDGDLSHALLFHIDTSMWKAGVDPMLDHINEAIASYRTGTGTCTQVGERQATRLELETAISHAGALTGLTQQMAKDYYYAVKGMPNHLHESIEDFHSLLMRLISGWTPDHLPAPTTSDVARALFAVIDGDLGLGNSWDDFKAVLEAMEPGVYGQVNQVDQICKSILSKTDEVLTLYIDSAWTINQDVPGQRSSVAGQQLMLVEMMSKEAALISLNVPQNLLSTIRRFETNHETLMQGNDNTGMRAIPATTEVSHDVAMQEVGEEWAAFKKVIEQVANDGYASTSKLEEVATVGAKLMVKLEAAEKLYSTMTITTTKTPISIMLPVPLSGVWTPGPTMRVAAMVAEDIINRQQILLPTYKIISDIFDDHCDPEWANRVMLEHFAESDAWVAMGGMGCSPVCESLAVITSSLYLPTISFECSDSEKLADVNLFPNFMRLGTKRDMTSKLLLELRKGISWWHLISIFSGDLDSDVYHSEEMVHYFNGNDLATTYRHVDEHNWEATMSMLSQLKTAKERIVYFIGSEAFFRRIICAAAVVEIFPGLTWISEGSKQKSWWTHDDPGMMAIEPSCNGYSIGYKFQGAMSIVGKGAPLPADQHEPLACFDGYTSATLNAYVKNRLATGYPADTKEYIVEYPHEELINFALDGICAFALSAKAMMERGYHIEDLRTPEEDTYKAIKHYMRHNLSFVGASGLVEFHGNDVEGHIAMNQVDDQGTHLAYLAKIDGTIEKHNVYDKYWADAPPDPITPMTSSNWRAVIVLADEQLRACHKAARLFLQAAARVNTFDSRVLFSDARVTARDRLETLLHGRERDNVPAKWFTPGIEEQLEKIWKKWTSKEELLADNIQTVSKADVDIIAELNEAINGIQYATVKLMKDVVDQCKIRDPSVPCEALKTLGYQGVLLQKMSKEAVLMYLDNEREENRKKLRESELHFDQSQHELVHGKAPYLARMTDYCTLQQLKDVTDIWFRFKAKVDNIYYDGATPATVLYLDTRQWSGGVDPMYNTITAAIEAFSNGHGTCTQVGDKQATREELEEVLKQMGLLRVMTRQLAKERFYSMLGVSVNRTDPNLFLTKVRHLISGWTPEGLPAPTSQAVADALFAIDDGYDGELSHFLHETSGEGRRLSVADIASLSDSLEAKTSAALDVMADSAWEINHDVPVARAKLSSLQAMRLEKMSQYAAMMSLGTNANLQQVMNEYETTHQLLVEGNGKCNVTAAGTVCGPNGVPETLENDHRVAMDLAGEKWALLRPALQQVLGGDRSIAAVENVTRLTHEMAADAQAVREIFGTMSKTTTKTPVDLMIPLPLTGVWAPGPTMLVAAQVAQEIINTQQLLLPGYELVSHFFDDECDPEQANRVVLEEYAENDNWVGIGGLGCSSVCKSLAVIATSVHLPLVSFECSDGDELSDTTLYSDFIRLGTHRTYVAYVMKELYKELFPEKWSDITIVAIDMLTFREVAENDQLHLSEKGITADVSLIQDSFTSAVEVMETLKARKVRLIIFSGSDTHYRKVICASGEVGIHTGLTWFSEGTRARSWWTADDEYLMKNAPACNGGKISELYQGALGVTGMGAPLEQHRDDPLDCFDGHTSETLNAVIRQRLAHGDAEDPNSTGIERPHDLAINLVADGMCMYALMVKYFLERGNSIEELRKPTKYMYLKMNQTLKHKLQFTGASGHIEVEGNDVPNHLAVWQVFGNESMMVGLADLEGHVNLSWSTGLRNESWTDAPEEINNVVEEEFPVVAVVLPAIFFFFCGIICVAAYSSKRHASNRGAAKV